MTIVPSLLRKVRRSLRVNASLILARFPSVHDGYECLGRLHQAKGDHRQAIDCYRKVIAFAVEEPQYYDPEFVDYFQELIAHIETQASAG